MLTIAQKAKILAKAGLGVALPQETAAPDDWEHRVEQSYVAYTAARAARSLREAENARQTEMLRRMAWSNAAL
ncbi:MAG: hypothetical protein JSR41_18970 [Proteobacteria bacterium]|nr:hypothetical protein [Pseudomonadota bacterium]